MPTSAVLEWVLARTPTLVVVTGGEPLLQQRHLIPLVEQLTDVGRVVEVETNGTITPDPALVAAVTAFNVSPKVASFAHPDDTVVRPAVLESLMASGKAVFKFVVTGPADLDDVGVLVEAHRLRPVWVMPAATTSGEALNGLRSVAEETLRRGWNLTGRLHLLLWEDVRGR
jgi:organic radical activating enzyme